MSKSVSLSGIGSPLTGALLHEMQNTQLFSSGSTGIPTRSLIPLVADYVDVDFATCKNELLKVTKTIPEETSHVLEGVHSFLQKGRTLADSRLAFEVGKWVKETYNQDITQGQRNTLRHIARAY